MISFQRRSLIDTIKYHLFPAYRAKSDADLKASIKELLDDPALPCSVEGALIQNGYSLPQQCTCGGGQNFNAACPIHGIFS